MLRQAATAAVGTPHELMLRRLVARALESLQAAEAAIQYHEVLERAEERQDYVLASVVAGDITRLLQRTGELQEALIFIDRQKEYDSRAGMGPWTLLFDELQRLQVLNEMGGYADVLEQAEALRSRMDTLPETSDKPETVEPFIVREHVLHVGQTAAHGQELWEQALALNAEQLKAQRRRGASALETARTAFDNWGPLVQLGRLHEARTLLLVCRETFEQERYIDGLGAALSALAGVEGELGRHDEAVRLNVAGLRLAYSAAELSHIAGSHFNMADSLNGYGGDPEEALAHRLAAAIIMYQTGNGRLEVVLDSLISDRVEREAVGPESWDQLCALVGRTEGVRLAELVDVLPARAANGPAALAEVLRLARLAEHAARQEG